MIQSNTPDSSQGKPAAGGKDEQAALSARGVPAPKPSEWKDEGRPPIKPGETGCG